MRPARICYTIGRYDAVADVHWFVRHDAGPGNLMLTTDPFAAIRWPIASQAQAWTDRLPDEVKDRVAGWPPLVIQLVGKPSGEMTQLVFAVDPESVL